MRVVELFKETMKGKSIGRILFNWEVRKHCSNLRGVMIDLACGSDKPSYYRFWSINPSKLIRVDSDEKARPDIVANLDESLPFKDDFADNVFLFNAIYILKKPENLVKEVFRILKDGGVFYFSSPFIFNESPEPHDYWRFTSEKLREFLEDAGFREIKIVPLGERFSAASYLIAPFLPRLLRFPLYILSLFLDKTLSKRKSDHPCPISYFCIAKKQGGHFE